MLETEERARAAPEKEEATTLSRGGGDELPGGEFPIAAAMIRI